MAMNWDLVVKIAVPLGTLVLGRWLDQIFSKKPKLVSFVGHVSAFTLQNANSPPTVVHTHAIVVRNVGRETANNVRIGHNLLPDFQLGPPVAHSVERDPRGGGEILIPKLVPEEQVTVSYLYFPPLTWGQINAYTKSDEGLARIIAVMPTPLPSKWLLRGLWALVFVGATALIYLAVMSILALIS